MTKLRIIESGDEIEVDGVPVYENGMWVTDTRRYVDLDKTRYELVAQPVTYGKVNPIHFKLCFTAAERVAINAARATDLILQDVFTILEDVRLQEVDLNLKSVSDTLDYLQANSLIAPGRKADILAGKLQ